MTATDVYLDQNVFSQAALIANWKDSHELGSIAMPLAEAGRIRIRPSQAHYNETLINVDVDEAHECALVESSRLDNRLLLARLIADCCDLSAPIPTWESESLVDVARLMAHHCPSSIFASGVRELQTIAAVGVSDKLRLLAGDRIHHPPEFYKHIWSRKLQTRLAHARPLDPEYLSALISAVKGNEKAAATVYDALDSLPLPILRRSIETQLSELKKLRQDGSRQLWQRNRQLTERAYTIDDSIGALQFFLLTQQEIMFRIFDVVELARGWSTVEASLGRRLILPAPLPNVEKALEGGMHFHRVVGALLQSLIEATVDDAAMLPTSRAAAYAACMQIERVLGGHDPSAGAVFDCEHILAALHVDIFYTLDVQLASIVRTFAKRVGRADLRVCSNKSEFARALRGL